MNTPKQWTFKDPDVVNNFDAHVREQLPWYDFATQAVAFLARNYITPKSTIYDIGASTGNIGNAIRDTIQQNAAHLIAIEESQEMADAYKGPGTLQTKKAEHAQYQDHALAIAFLTFQFIPTPKRARLLERITEAQQEGGALILVDKFQPTSLDHDANNATYRLTLDAKLKAGAKPENIINKELSLIGSQKPLNGKLLEPYNATQFFAYGQFQGYIVTL